MKIFPSLFLLYSFIVSFKVFFHLTRLSDQPSVRQVTFLPPHLFRGGERKGKEP